MLTRSIVLIGLMGSGKTTVGKRLAKQLGCTFVDTDDVVLKATGLSVRDIFERFGETVFRDHETRALQSILLDDTPKVIAAAGGAVLAENNRRAISDSSSYVVWLDTEPSNLLKRVSFGPHRPLLDDDAPTTLEAMSTVRKGLYSELADTRVDTNSLNVHEVVNVILKNLEFEGIS